MQDKKGEAPRKAGENSRGARDKRRYERLKMDTEVRYKVIQRPDAPPHPQARAFQPDGRSLNISLCGLAISTKALLKKGDYLKLELSLPGRVQSIRALAEVMWAESGEGGNSAGIRFLILLNQADDAQIRRFIDHHPDRAARR